MNKYVTVNAETTGTFSALIALVDGMECVKTPTWSDYVLMMHETLP